MNPLTDEVEYLPETADGAQRDEASETHLERSGGLSLMWVVVVLLAALYAIAAMGVVRLGALLDRTETLIVEQQRATCYERLQWLGDSFGGHPAAADLKAGASRQCEGDEPLVAFAAE